jgi:hypothetical protein
MKAVGLRSFSTDALRVRSDRDHRRADVTWVATIGGTIR